MNKYHGTGLWLCFLTFACATQTSGQNELPTEQIEVVKDFEVRLAKTRKINLSPPVLLEDTSVVNYNYNVSSEIPPIEYGEPTIKPSAYRNPAPVATHRGFLRGGYGMPNSILGDISYHLVDRDNVNLAVFGTHESANNKDVAFMKYMDNDIGIKGNYTISPAIMAIADLRYSYDKYYYYADVPEGPSFSEDGRTYKSFIGGVGITNSEILDNRLSYALNVNYISHKDDLGVSEDNFIAQFTGAKTFANGNALSLELNADLSTLKDQEKRKLNNYHALPTYSLSGARYKISAGVRVALADDQVYVYPEIHGSYKVISNKLIAIAGSSGSLFKNNFYNLSGYNPFIHDQISDLRNTSYTNVYGGAKGRVMMFEYRAQASYSWLKDLALYLPDEDDMRKFQPVYDDGGLFKIEAEVSAEPLDRLEVGLSAAKMFYSTDNEVKAWHLPGFEGRLFATYTLLDNRLRLRLDMFTQTGIWYIREDGFGDTLNPLFDISIGADWFFIDWLGVYVQLNNITGNNRERWYRYPSIGFQPMGGIIARF